MSVCMCVDVAVKATRLSTSLIVQTWQPVRLLLCYVNKRVTFPDTSGRVSVCVCVCVCVLHVRCAQLRQSKNKLQQGLNSLGQCSNQVLKAWLLQVFVH